METYCIPLEETGSLPSLVADLQKDPASLHPFRAFPPSPEGYDKAIAARELDSEARQLLADRLRSQYEADGLKPGATIEANIEALKSSETYTVTTGHQLCLFTGPLLTIHKTLHTIRLAEELQERHPDKRFVPVHWMASEDHDRDEIDHIVTQGERFRWDTDQTGAVGRMKPEGLEEIISRLRERTETLPHGKEWIELLEYAYSGSSTWAQATRKLLNALFGDRGLLILDGDDAELKKSFREDLKKEFTEQRSSRCVEGTDEALRKEGYAPQVHSRSINLFYLDEGYRERIEEQEEGVATVDGKKKWEQEELLKELDEHPERFSPNVVLRPLYQERILPNVAYVGGPAEVAYWHQLKGLFEEAGAFFPLLQLRSQVFHLDRKTAQLMDKAHVGLKELFIKRDELIREKVKEQSENDLELEAETEEIRNLYQKLAQKASEIDPNLWDSVMAEHRKAEKGMERIRKKMIRHAKKHDKILTDRIESIYDRAFPGGTPQERVENLTPYYASEGDAFIRKVEELLHPLHAEAVLIVEKEG